MGSFADPFAWVTAESWAALDLSSWDFPWPREASPFAPAELDCSRGWVEMGSHQGWVRQLLGQTLVAWGTQTNHPRESEGFGVVASYYCSPSEGDHNGLKNKAINIHLGRKA